MCQGVIFVYDYRNNQYHWGIGSHAELIEKLFDSDSPRLYDNLVRVECNLDGGPGDYSIEGGNVDVDQKKLFEDRLIAKVGTPQKLIKFVQTMTAEPAGFSWDDSLLNVLNRDGVDQFRELIGRYQTNTDDDAYYDSLDKSQKALYSIISDLDEDIYEIEPLQVRMSIYLIVRKKWKKILIGKAFNRAFDKLRETEIKVVRGKLLKQVKIAISNLHGDDVVAVTQDADNFGDSVAASDVLDAVRNSVNMEDISVDYIDEGDDPFDALNRIETVKANKLYALYISALRKKLPARKKRRTRKPLSEVEAFAVVAAEKQYLIPEWARAFDLEAAPEKKSAKKPVKKVAAKKVKRV